jgi:hypothetical protein
MTVLQALLIVHKAAAAICHSAKAAIQPPFKAIWMPAFAGRTSFLAPGSPASTVLSQRSTSLVPELP